MSSCEKYQELISRMIDGELDEEERAGLAAHLESCRECALMYSAFSGLSGAIASDLEDVPDALHENIMAEVRREHLAAQNRRRFSRQRKKHMAAAACFAVLILAAAGAGSLFNHHSKFAADSAAPAQAAPYFAAESQAAASDSEDGAGSIRISGGPEQNSSSMQAVEPAEEAMSADSAEILPRQLPCSWEELSAFLSGKPEALELSEGSEPFLALSLETENGPLEVKLYEHGGNLYFTLSSDDTVYSTPCSRAELEAFLEEQE